MGFGYNLREQGLQRQRLLLDVLHPLVVRFHGLLKLQPHQLLLEVLNLHPQNLVLGVALVVLLLDLTILRLTVALTLRRCHTRFQLLVLLLRLLILLFYLFVLL